MVTMSADRHITDGDLIGLLDGEASTSRSDVETHVDTCVVCTARLAQLQQRSAQVRKLLGAVDGPPIDRARLLPSSGRGAEMRRSRERRFWSHAGLRAAAGLLLAAGIAAASPARDWILDRMTGRHAIANRNQPRRPTTAPTRRPGQAAGSVVRFPAESDELLVRFAARPTGGTLTVLAGTDSLSSAQVVSGVNEEAFLVLPNELRIRNTPDSRADYQLIVSSIIRRVAVHVGDTGRREITTIHVVPGMRQTVGLGSPGGSR
jgi:anti-sigma factor RsiW